MNDAERLEGRRKRHEESQGPWPEAGHVCLECWQRWPCDFVQLFDALAAGVRLSPDDGLRAKAQTFLDHVAEAASWPTPGIGCDGNCLLANDFRAALEAAPPPTLDAALLARQVDHDIDDFLGWLFRDGGAEPPRRSYEAVESVLRHLFAARLSGDQP